MDKGFDVSVDIRNDSKADLKNGAGNDAKADYGGDLAKDAGVNLNNIASGVGEAASSAADIASTVASGAVDIASTIVSGAAEAASAAASGAVKLIMTAAAPRKSEDLNKFAKAYEYDPANSGDYNLDTYNESGDDTNPLAVPSDTVSNEYNSNFTDAEYGNSLDGSGSEEFSKYSKDTDTEQLDSVLDNFQGDKWSDLSLEEQKQSMTELVDYVANETGNKNPPEITFRNDMNDGEYGGYNPETNTLEINENMLDDSAEAADTVAHEMWHAYQQQCANDPNNTRAQEYREGFDNYISPEYDFEGYQNQMVEAEARDYAQGFKDRIAGV